MTEATYGRKILLAFTVQRCRALGRNSMATGGRYDGRALILSCKPEASQGHSVDQEVSKHQRKMARPSELYILG